MRAGIIASVIANVGRDRRKRPEPFSPRDFMVFIEHAPEAEADLSQKLKQAFTQFKGAKALKKRKKD